eukprot:144552_1
MSTKQKKKVGFAGTDNNKQKQNESAAPFKHSHKKTAHALEHAKMVQKGKKFWEQKEQYQPISDVEWWQLKAAKDFEAGIGQTFYHEGTLSLWTDEQVAALQKEMKETLQLAGYEDESINPVRLKTPQHTILPGQKATTTMDDFAAEIQKQQNKTKNKSKQKHKQKQQEEESKDPLYDFDDEIIHTGHSDDEDSDGKQSKYNGNSMVQFDIKQLTSVDDLGKFDENKVRSHKRTRTEALRMKLNNMQSELNKVTEIRNKQTDVIEENKRKEEDAMQLQVQLSGLTGALQGATDELDRAEEQISEKDKQIANLRRELKISKQMNRELAQTTMDVTNSTSGLTADDLLKQRIKDANRFAFMLSAMQEQLDFERKQFVKKIHTLELRLEHKDVQLGALYQLYNQLVDQTQTARKSWWERLTTK